MKKAFTAVLALLLLAAPVHAAKFTFETSDDNAKRFVDAICGLNGYSDTLEGSPNPETRAAYAKRKTKEWMVGTVDRWEEMQRVQAARNQKPASILVSES